MQHSTTIQLTFALAMLAQHCLAVELSDYSNGKKDATEALQQAIEESDGLVEIPAGTYIVSRTLTIDLAQFGYRTIRGSSATKLVMRGKGPLFRFQGSHYKSAAPDGFSQQVWQRERMPLVSDLTIEGEHTEADGIQATGTMQLTVSHVHLRKLRHAVHLIENNRNVLIDSCQIYQCAGIGIWYDDVNLHQSNILGCHISYCDQGGIVSRGGNVRNIHITGCDIESNMAASAPPTANVLIDCRGSRYGTAEVAITGCTIQHNDDGPQSANIRIIGSSLATEDAQPVREGNITITGNILSDVQTNVHLKGCRGVTLVGNTFWMGFKHNLLVEDCSHIVIGSNNLDRNPRYDYGNSTESHNSVVFRDSEDCTITGLHVSRVVAPPAAVSLSNCRRFNIAALTILDCPVGLLLDDLQESVVGNCLIRSGADLPNAKRTIVRGGSDNYLDATIREP